MSRKKDAHKAMCMDGTEENWNRYKIINNKAKRVVMIVMTEEVLTELKTCLNAMF